MKVDLQTFFRATNPSKTLAVESPEDRKYYIDFFSVRGGKIIEELKDNIAGSLADETTYVLLTGHIGCGKSTELLRKTTSPISPHIRNSHSVSPQ